MDNRPKYSQRFAVRQADVGATRAGRHHSKVNMTNHHPNHFVVDGSNIATEGRSRPSLEQLNDAVLAFMKQFPDTVVTVVVDATFGHRIDSSEVAAFDEAIANNELVAPPAGAIGRGDAFVLMIANQADAGVLSNDSFQEFHGDYDWLFDEGRLVGGKPVPNVGWVFVDRTPVRGPKSREAVKKARSSAKSSNRDKADLKAEKQQAASRVRKKSAAAAPKTGNRTSPAESSSRDRAAASGSADKRSVASDESPYVNELLPFLEFVEHHPVGTSVKATVDKYSSHGAYLSVDGVDVYLPLQNIADPAPPSARSVLKLGEVAEVVVVGFQPERRSIDVAFAEIAPQRLEVAADAKADVDVDQGAVEPQASKKAGAKQSATRSATKTAAKAAAGKRSASKTASAAKKPAAKKSATKKAASKTPAKKAATKSPAKKATAKKTAAKKTAATTGAGAKKAAGKNATGTKSTTKKATGTKATGTTAKRSASKKASASES